MRPHTTILAVFASGALILAACAADPAQEGEWTPMPAEPTPAAPGPGEEPAPGTEPTPDPAAEPTPVPGTEPTPDPITEPTPDPGTEPTPDPAAEPTPEPGVGVDPDEPVMGAIQATAVIDIGGRLRVLEGGECTVTDPGMQPGTDPGAQPGTEQPGTEQPGTEQPGTDPGTGQTQFHVTEGSTLEVRFEAGLLDVGDELTMTITLQRDGMAPTEPVTPDPGAATPDPGAATPDPGAATPDPGAATPDPGTAPAPGEQVGMEEPFMVSGEHVQISGNVDDVDLAGAQVTSGAVAPNGLSGFVVAQLDAQTLMINFLCAEDTNGFEQPGDQPPADQPPADDPATEPTPAP